MDALSEALDVARDRRRLPPPAKRRALRERAGLSQPTVARVIGATASAVSRWETGQRTPRGTMLRAYLELLNRLGESASR